MHKTNKNIFLKTSCLALALSIPFSFPAIADDAKKVSVNKEKEAQLKERLAIVKKIFDERVIAKNIKLNPDEGTVDLSGLGKFAMKETDRPYVELKEEPLQAVVDNLSLIAQDGHKNDITIAIRHEDQILPPLVVGKTVTRPEDSILRLNGLTDEDVAEIERAQIVSERAPEGVVTANIFYLPKGGRNWYWHGKETTISKHPTASDQYQITTGGLSNDAIYALDSGTPVLKAVDPAEFSKNWDKSQGRLKSFAEENPNFILMGRGADGQLVGIKGKLTGVDATGTIFYFKAFPGTTVPLGPLYKAASWVDFGTGGGILG